MTTTSPPTNYVSQEPPDIDQALRRVRHAIDHLTRALVEVRLAEQAMRQEGRS
jgi:hypothetical protein